MYHLSGKYNRNKGKNNLISKVREKIGRLLAGLYHLSGKYNRNKGNNNLISKVREKTGRSRAVLKKIL